MPAFSGRHDITHAALFEMVFALDFDGLAVVLEEIFPSDTGPANALGGIEEESDDRNMTTHGYPDIHDSIIAPLREIDHGVKEMSVGISHYYQAWGSGVTVLFMHKVVASQTEWAAYFNIK